MDFRPLVLTINALTIDGKAVTKAVWDQIPVVTVRSDQKIPSDITLLGWVNVHARSCDVSAEHRHFIGFSDEHPVHVVIQSYFRAGVLRDTQNALVEVMTCWYAQIQQAGSRDVAPPVPWLREVPGTTAYEPAFPSEEDGGPNESALPRLSIEAVRTPAMLQRLYSGGEQSVLAPRTAEWADRWASMSEEDLVLCKDRIDLGVGRMQKHYEQMRDERAAAWQLPQLFIAVGAARGARA